MFIHTFCLYMGGMERVIERCLLFGVSFIRGSTAAEFTYNYTHNQHISGMFQCFSLFIIYISNRHSSNGQSKRIIFWETGFLQIGHSTIWSAHNWQVPWPQRKTQFFLLSIHTWHWVWERKREREKVCVHVHSNACIIWGEQQSKCISTTLKTAHFLMELPWVGLYILWE